MKINSKVKSMNVKKAEELGGGGEGGVIGAIYTSF